MGQQNPTVMISLGGNAISPKNESGTIDDNTMKFDGKTTITIKE